MAGWEVRIVKNCDRGIEVFAFQTRGHSFSLHGQTQSRSITFLSFFVPAVNWLTCAFGLRAVYKPFVKEFNLPTVTSLAIQR